MSFALLNTHSYFSMLEGVPSPSQLLERIAEHGYQAAVLTDRQYISGAVEFTQTAQTGKFRIGMGLTCDVVITHGDLRPSGEIELLAQNEAGWRNICALASLPHPLPMSHLSAHAGGLLCLTGGRDGLLARLQRAGRNAYTSSWLTTMKQSFGDRLYVQLDIRRPNDEQLAGQLADLAAAHDLPTVAAPSIYYLDEDQAELQRLLSAIRHNTTRDDTQLTGVHAHASLPSVEQMAHNYRAFPDALTTTMLVIERCAYQLPLGQSNFPHLALPAGQSADEALRSAAYMGAQTTYGELTPTIAARLEHELGLIADLGYAPIFLMMAEAIAFTHEADILTGSRGSASSSLVAHCLGITEPDPIALDLLFERFLNPARAKPPDIDVDIESHRRDQVIQHMVDTYGEDRVAMVATINRFRRRSALRAAAKAHGLPEHTISAMTRELPRRWHPGRRGEGRKQAPFEEIEAAYPSYRELFAQAEQLLGIPHHLSVHPGGLIVSPEETHALVATERAPKGVEITHFDLDGVEPLGLVKVDLLGIRGLSVLADVAEYMRTADPERFPTRRSFIERIPLDDEDTAALVRSTQTIGCFQIESEGMRRTLAEVHAASVDDIRIALALFRPGPLTGGLKDAFVRRHLGQERVSYLHPTLEPILADTLGVLLYQEDVLRIAIQIADFTAAEADLLRRAMSHFDPGGAMQELKNKFVTNAGRLHEIPKGTALKIWDLMYAFAGYGFPKAHAASYSLAAWRSAYCKAHHPAWFMAAVLANWGGYYRQSDYIKEARRMGLDVRTPHINHSQREFVVDRVEGREALFMGLDQVRDLSRRTIRRILAGRPFTSLDDLMTRTMPGKKEIRHLIQVGALEGLGSIPALLGELEGGSWQADQPALFQLEHAAPRQQDEWSPAQRAQAQRKLLGISLIDSRPTS